MKIQLLFPTGCLTFLFCCCTGKPDTSRPEASVAPDSIPAVQIPAPDTVPKPILIRKALLYDKHTLDDTYAYKDTTRRFQWDKIKAGLATVEKIRNLHAQWGILQNYRNRNGEAPLVRNFRRDSYKRVADTLGVERYQSVPLYLTTDTGVPELYGHDGSLVKYLGKPDTASRFAEIETVYTRGTWKVPDKYLRLIDDTVSFNKVIFVDRVNQNIATLEKSDTAWLVRSMNPATTGVHRPPYAQETPLGIFVIQEKKPRMIYLVDGSTATGGFAPYASRFSNGGYIHGVPVNAPRTGLIEFSPTLGTTPRSHMCVRNATSHAKFIYDWAPVNGALVFVFD
ncbi:MAG: L,D-transpeptidase [Parabacteroides sp.]|nr:L,D-transpeptidase [Parabacteroides sp.]